MKKVLVIDDSTLMRRVMSDIIGNTKEYVVAYTAGDGVEGLAIIEEKDDIIAIFCDINMPRMNGLELLKIIRERKIDIPFILFSSQNDAKDTITALELGATEFIKKPIRVFTDVEFRDKVNKALIIATSVQNKKQSDLVKTEVKLEAASSLKSTETRLSKSTGRVKRLVALVCSTGGPKALQEVIPKLPKNLNAPVLIVQHMPAGFTETMAHRLNDLSQIKVKEAEEGEPIEKGVCYIAKGGTHLGLSEASGRVSIYFDDTPPIGGLKPCGNIMYNSICNINAYDEIVCVVLTGMGADGSKGITELNKHKKIFVIAQDEKSSTVYGMPKAIYDRGLTDVVSDLNNIANEIIKKVGVS